MITLTEEQAEQILFDDLPEDSEFVFIKRLDWEDDGKYSLGGAIFFFKGKLYKLQTSRCGSYHTDYYYTHELGCHEVKSENKLLR